MSAPRTYVRPMQGWWRRNAFYRWYMVRELTCIAVIVYALELLTGLWRLTQGRDAAANHPADPEAVRWTAAAEARLANIPEFVRPMARTGIERFARERGAREVDDAVLDAAREFFGM